MKIYLASNIENERDNIEPIWNVFSDVVEKWIVVDSGSTDGTQQELRRVVGDRLVLIESDIVKHNGYGYSRTKLIEFSEGADFVLIWDGDERATPDDAARIPQVVKENYDCDIIMLPRCHYHDWDMSIVEYGAMDKLGEDSNEALNINPDWQPRLIKRTIINGKSKVRFTRRVHELVEGIDKECKDLSNPVIRHFGWLKTDEKKKAVAALCDELWKMDKENKEIVDSYILENEAGTAVASSPWNTVSMDTGEIIHEAEPMNMTEVSEGLYVGDSGDANNDDLLNENNIVTIVNVAYDLDIADPIKEYEHIGFVDGPGNDVERLWNAAKLVTDKLTDGNVLVCCHEGKSRSVVVAAMALIVKNNFPVQEYDIQLNTISNLRNSRPDEELVKSGRNALLREL